MNCQEVVEFMQRDLDQDLSEEESQILQAHLNKCHECADVYHKMTMLSNELTQLPKVDPPYSLVDRIMPQIEQLERESEAVQDHVVKMSWGQRLTRTLTKRTFGSLAAAAVLLLVIVFSNNAPFTSNDAFQEANVSGGFVETHQDDGLEMESTPILYTATDQGGKAADKPSSHDEFNMLRSPVFTASADELLSEHAIELHYPSPGDVYTAIVRNEENKYQILIVNALGVSVYQSSVFEADDLNAVRWSEDGKQLLYEVIRNDAAGLSTIIVD